MAAFEQGHSPETIQQQFPDLSLEVVYGASTYYLAHHDGALVAGFLMVKQSEPVGRVIDDMILIWSASEMGGGRMASCADALDHLFSSPGRQ